MATDDAPTPAAAPAPETPKYVTKEDLKFRLLSLRYNMEEKIDILQGRFHAYEETLEKMRVETFSLYEDIMELRQALREVLKKLDAK